MYWSYSYGTTSITPSHLICLHKKHIIIQSKYFIIEVSTSEHKNYPKNMSTKCMFNSDQRVNLNPNHNPN